MASESNLPIVNLEDSPAPTIPPESATAKENRLLRVCMMEMYDALVNGKEPIVLSLGSWKWFPGQAEPHAKSIYSLWVQCHAQQC